MLKDEQLSLTSKNRSLKKASKNNSHHHHHHHSTSSSSAHNRKGSLNRSEETSYLTLANTSAGSGPNHHNTSLLNVGGGGSTALNYSNSTASSASSSAAAAVAAASGQTRKSLISNPINFQHLQHLGPSDGKSAVMLNDLAAGLPPLAGGSSTRVVNLSAIANVSNPSTNNSAAANAGESL